MQIEYINISKCPLCNSEGNALGAISMDKYRFGGREIDLPDEGVQLVKCTNCTLHFKNKIPSKAALAKLFEMVAQNVWVGKRLSYQREIDLLSRFTSPVTTAISLLDVGSSDGAFLRTIKSLATTRSACDVYIDPRCEKQVNGEYIKAFIEDPELNSALQYDVISMFDILEHLYSPNLAFNNVAQLGKNNSLVIIETGDISNINRPSSWWYTGYIEHHIFWTRRALETLAESHGYQLIHFENLPHKGRRYMPLLKRLLASGLFALHKIPSLRKAVFALSKLRIEMIGNPFQRDHMLVLLKRKSPTT